MIAFATSAFLFLALITGAIAVFAGGRPRSSAVDRRLIALRAADNDSHQGTPSFKRPLSSIPTLQRLLGASAWADGVALELRRANINLRVGEYLLVRGMLGLLVFAIAVLITRFQPVGVGLGLAAGALASFVPAFYVSHLRRRRIAKIEAQLIELAPMIASALRSGFAFTQGVELAAQQMEPPLADELALLLNDANLGATMEEALQDLGRRIGSTNLDMMITAILVQRTSGGNLSEILDKAGETLRERERIRGDLQTLTAQMRLTGTILSIYPVAIGLLLLVVMPSLWTILFTDVVGRVFLAIALGLQLVGFLAMRKVMNIDI